MTVSDSFGACLVTPAAAAGAEATGRAVEVVAVAVFEGAGND